MLNSSIAHAADRRVRRTSTSPGWILDRAAPGVVSQAQAKSPTGRLSSRVWKLLGIGPVNQAFRGTVDSSVATAFGDQPGSNGLASAWTAARALPMHSDALPGVPATRWLLQR